MFRGAAILAVPLLVACASVPKEVVELSYVVGHDLDAVRISYRTLIHTHFDDLRSRANAFLEDQWVPAFLSDFVQRGQLVENARGSDPRAVLEDVSIWAESAMEEINDKRRVLIEPIDRDEASLMSSVDEAFDRLTRANATITAHLNSLRKVQEVQDEALKSLRLQDLREVIDQRLVAASDATQKAIEKLAEEQEGFEGVKSRIQRSRGTAPGGEQ
ncbi:MAG: hypothetical protein ACOYXR_06065 [Nitrospirota bacterium]